MLMQLSPLTQVEHAKHVAVVPQRVHRKEMFPELEQMSVTKCGNVKKTVINNQTSEEKRVEMQRLEERGQRGNGCFMLS